jgi:hypothetical protein
MINQLTYQANVARLDDLRREAERQRRYGGESPTPVSGRPRPRTGRLSGRLLPMRLARRGGLS